MKIIKLQAENVKRLKAVTIEPSGAVVQITGRNGAGKSSVLDAIEYGLAGKSAIPDKPIRKGAAGAKIVIDLGDIVVTRRWSVSGNTTLVIESKDGEVLASPQAVLDRLTGHLTFDPLLFLRMAPRDQIETLKRIAGIDFTDLDKQRADMYADRAAINRDASSARARVGALPDAEPPPGWVEAMEESDLSVLMDAQEGALIRQRDNQELLGQLDGHTNRAQEMGLRFDELKQRVESLTAHRKSLGADMEKRQVAVERLVEPDIKAIENKIAQLMDAQSKALAQERDNQEVRRQLADCTNQDREAALKFDELTRQVKLLSEERRVLNIGLEDCKRKVKDIVDPDIEGINTRIAQSDAINRHIRDTKMRADLAESHKSLVAQSDSLTAHIQQIDQDKATAIKDASLPVDNIGFDDNIVTLNGLPIDQASSSEKIRATVLMGCALNPELRIMLLPEGSLLDEEGLRLLAEIAETNNMQIWVERVTNGEKVGVVIEDGRVAE